MKLTAFFVLGVIAATLNKSHAAVDWTKSLLIASTGTGNMTSTSRLVSMAGDPTFYAPMMESANNIFAGLFDDDKETTYRHRDFFHTLSVDYDAQLVYNGDNANHRLSAGLYVYQNSTTEKLTINIGNTREIKSVSLDWVSKNLYWTQGESVKVIRISQSSSQQYQKTLVSTGLHTVLSVVVNPLEGYLFWCDSISFERSDLSGNGRTLLLHQNAAMRNSSLTIDYTFRRLYYLSDTRLGWMNYNGSNHGYVDETVSSYLAIHGNILILSNSENYTVDFYERQNTNITHYYSLITDAPERITGIAMFSRESQPTVASPCNTNNGGCEHFCFTASSTTKVCGCDRYYFLNTDGTSCTLSNDWTKSLLIATTCRTTQVSILISLIGDPTNYAPLIASTNDYTGLFDDSKQSTFTYGDFFHTLSVDYGAQLVYYGDNAKHELASALFVYQNSTLQKQTIPTGNAKEITSVSLDWTSKNLYWTQGDSISVVRFGLPSTQLYTKTLVSTDLFDVQDIVVNPRDGYLFWCDSNTIGRSDLTGNGRTLLYTNNSVHMLSLTIDYGLHRLYYVSNATLGWMNYDGSNHSCVAHVGSSSLAIHRNILILGNHDRFTIDFFDRQTAGVTHYGSLTYYTLDTITDIAMFSAESQPTVTSPCNANNGGCEHFCFATSSTARVCACDNNYFLNADGTSCLTITTTTTTTPRKSGSAGVTKLSVRLAILACLALAIRHQRLI